MPDGTMLLRFEAGVPSLLRWDGTRFDRLPPDSLMEGRVQASQVVACIPDSLVTLQKAQVGQGFSRSQCLQAARMQLQSLFPQVPGAHKEVLVTPWRDVLLIFLHPEASAFFAAHAALLDKAAVWTTSCLLGYAAGRTAGLAQFCWPGEDDFWLVASPAAVTVAAGGLANAQARMQLLGSEADFSRLEWPEVMAAIDSRRLRPAAIDLALRGSHSASAASWRQPLRIAAAASLVGALFVAGALHTWRAAQAQEQQWTAAAREVAASACALMEEPAGLDPVSTLRTLVHNAQGGEAESLDLLRLLALLCRHAPADVTLQRIAYAKGAGTVLLRATDLQSLQHMLAAVNQEAEGLVLHLDNVEKRPQDLLAAVSVQGGL